MPAAFWMMHPGRFNLKGPERNAASAVGGLTHLQCCDAVIRTGREMATLRYLT